MRIAGHARKHGQSVQSIIGFIVFLQNLVELFARVLVVPIVQQGDGVVVVLFRVREGVFLLRALLQAGGAVHSGTIAQVSRTCCEHPVECRLRLVELALLHQPQSCFVLGDDLRACMIGGGRGSCQCLRTSFRCGYTCCLRLSHGFPVAWLYLSSLILTGATPVSSRLGFIRRQTGLVNCQLPPATVRRFPPYTAGFSSGSLYIFICR